MSSTGPRVRSLSNPDPARFGTLPEPDPERFGPPLVPLLPPQDRRTGREEDSLRHTHWKDILALGAGMDAPATVGDGRGPRLPAPEAPWRPVSPIGSVPDALLGDPFVEDGATLLLSSYAERDAADVATKGPRVDTRAWVRDIAREAEQSAANATIRSAGDAGAGDAAEESGPRTESVFEVEASSMSNNRRGRGGSGNLFEKWTREGRFGNEISDEFRDIPIGPDGANGRARLGYYDAFGGTTFQSDSERTAVGGGASLEAGLFQYDVDSNPDGVNNLNAEGRFVAADAALQAGAEVVYPEREATLNLRVAGLLSLHENEFRYERVLGVGHAYNFGVRGVNWASSWFKEEKLLEEVDADDYWKMRIRAGGGYVVGAGTDANFNARATATGYRMDFGATTAAIVGVKRSIGIELERPQ